jgi:transcriptional regulator with XRE-family HTH domain
MPTSTAIQFGKLLRTLREQAGLSQDKLAACLKEEVSLINELEAGSREPPADPKFYDRLQKVPGFHALHTMLEVQDQDIDSYPDWLAEDNQRKQERQILQRWACRCEAVWCDGNLKAICRRCGQQFMLNPSWTVSEDDAQEPSTRSFTSTRVRVIISPPMPAKEVENGDHLTEHISDLQSQATLGSETNQRPSHYPHHNVVFHVAQLRAEALSQQSPAAGSGVIYDRGRLMTLAEASKVSGVKLGTVYNYLNDGKLTVRGRIFSPSPGGGKVLIDLDELNSLPRRPRGRPKKNSVSK